jgi:hypothetical protein
MASLKKAPPPKKSAQELKAKAKMLRCLAEPKELMPSDYKHTIQNPHCANRSDEILENEDKQMLKFCQEAGLSFRTTTWSIKDSNGICAQDLGSRRTDGLCETF